MKFALDFFNQLPQTAGIYKFCDRKGSILYIGKAKNLKKRVLSYFYRKSDFNSRIDGLVNNIYFVDIIQVNSEFEALLLEAKLIKTYQPKYNLIWKDDKHYIHIKITNDEFPRILLSRREDETSAIYFGPFPSTRIVRDVLTYIRQIFPFCTQNPRAKQKCFYTHLDLCNPCPAIIKKKVGQKYLSEKKLYLKNIKQIKALLQGLIGKVKYNLEKQMRYFSKIEEFEQAAKVRDKLYKFNYLVNNYQPADSYIDNPILATQTWDNEQKKLTEILSDYFPRLNLIKKIECYDISNIFGRFAVGSMVTFIGGQPVKYLYRRFRIKSKTKKSDFDMLKEVMQRRLNHQEWLLPDLMVIDGGKPQLVALKKVIAETGLNIPMIGLVKKTEKLVIPGKNNFIELELPADSSALHLIQRLRDEAHRFAHQYYESLRLKYLISSVESG